jgi:hypothetical protein
MYFHLTNSGFSGTTIIPIFNLATIGLMILGTLKGIRDWFMARSYVVLTLAVVTAIIMFCVPHEYAVVFVPTALLTTFGIDTLINEWYKLFPRNPYARVVGLLPLTALFLIIALGNISHYFGNNAHITNAAYSPSLGAIKSALTIEGDYPVTLLVGSSDLHFYEILKKEYGKLTVTTTVPETTATPVLVLPGIKTGYGRAPSNVVINPTVENIVALRVYRPQ